MTQLARDLLASKYDPDRAYEEAGLLRANQTNADREAWLAHPLTKALLLVIEGDIAGSFLFWTNGAYATNPGEDAKARGMIEALDGISTYVRNTVGGDTE